MISNKLGPIGPTGPIGIKGEAGIREKDRLILSHSARDILTINNESISTICDYKKSELSTNVGISIGFQAEVNKINAKLDRINELEIIEEKYKILLAVVEEQNKKKVSKI